ncbi:hypothetical protein M8C21_026783 [Ambrosia artemisiifolia]|uniref:DNA-directed RNA polymerase I subunit rpa49 n=1 Tax=Ambrosia artemisiifolia TaxID=4212 RepID=A0AAD5DHN0_AMBAR|nr:hypothetical protein M8C21_026783 [Ambrosia artemisiifolia]
MGKKHKKDTEPDHLPTEENDVVMPEQPSKKKHKTKKTHNRQEEKIEVQIQTIKPKPDKSLPLIGYFPSGYDPDNHQRVEEQPTIKLFKHVQRHNRLELSVTPSQSSMVKFVGMNYKGESAAPQMCSYALGVLDKKTNTLKIVQIEANKIFRLEPRIEGQDEAEEEVASKKVENEETVEEDSKLKFTFSTKKAQQSARKEKALRAYRDPAAQEDLNDKMAEAVVNTEDIEISAQASITARNIPPHDMSATIPQQAYPLEKIILKGEWRYLSDITKLLQEGKAINTPSYPQFVCNRIHKIEEVKDEEVKESLSCIFSYINHLIKFKDKNSMDGYSSAKNHKLPNILTQKFNDMFGNTESKRLADDKRSLLISYVLVLTLFVDDFKTEFSDIAKDLRMTAGALRPHFEALGCKFVRENNITLAALPAPLKFPEIRRRRRR